MLLLDIHVSALADDRTCQRSSSHVAVQAAPAPLVVCGANHRPDRGLPPSAAARRLAAMGSKVLQEIVAELVAGPRYQSFASRRLAECGPGEESEPSTDC